MSGTDHMTDIDRLREHLVAVHGMTPTQTTAETLHAQDHEPGHGYGGHGWQHAAEDLFVRIDEEGETSGTYSEE